MDKLSIIHSLKELEDSEDIEILNQSRNSICLYDYQDGKEIVYTFKRSKTELASHIHISRKIPKKLHKSIKNAYLGHVSSNISKRKNPLKMLDFQGSLAEGVRFELTRP